MKLLIVIVNYKSADLAVDCLASLAPQVSSDMRVVITDNQSPDDSVAKLTAAIERNNWSSWVSVKPLDHNGGFAYGNNRGIEPALASDQKPQYVLLLNPDTVLRP